MGVTKKLSVDEVTGRRDQGQERSSDDPRSGQGKDHLDEGSSTIRVQIGGSLQKGGVHLLQGDIYRQRHERQEVVGDAGNHCPARREKAPIGGQDADDLQSLDHWPTVGEDYLPCECPEQKRNEEGHQHEDQEDVLVPPTAERDPVGKRICDQQCEEGRRPGVEKRPQELLSETIERRQVIVPSPGKLVSRLVGALL